MRGVFLFIAGIVVALAVEAAVAQNQSPNHGIVGLNHVCIVVPDLDQALNYYTKTLGFPEAFRSKDDKGNVTLVYVQISQNTFIELQPATPQKPAGDQSLWSCCGQYAGGNGDVQRAGRATRGYSYESDESHSLQY